MTIRSKRASKLRSLNQSWIEVFDSITGTALETSHHHRNAFAKLRDYSLRATKLTDVFPAFLLLLVARTQGPSVTRVLEA